MLVAPFKLFSKKRSKFAGHFTHCLLGQLADKLGVPDAPIETFHLIGENDASELKSGRNGHFEGITLLPGSSLGKELQVRLSRCRKTAREQRPVVFQLVHGQLED